MSQITEEEYETAYKVLEQVREEASDRNEAMITDVHYMVQLHEEESR
jgi:predicted RNA-binding protein associated with RNAse of E/G family